MKQQRRNSITPKDFAQRPEVQKCLSALKAKFGANFEKLLVSDTLDGEGHQYVNLVQKGGGVLGVALVGYTYILEQAGIRFLRMAGTSAGAINTAMMTVIGKKQDAKSEKVLQYLCDLDFFALVDGHPFARWFIRNFITHKSFAAKLSGWLTRIFASFGLLIFLDILFLGLGNHYVWASVAARVTFVLTGFNLLLIGAMLFYVKYLVSRLRNCGYGINPGKFFYDWTKQRMAENDVRTVSEMNAKASADIPGLRVRKPETQSTEGLKGDVTFITAELVTQNKVEFPKMCNLFRVNPDDLHPARFVRASMSIPVFFESHIINDIPQDKVKDAWKLHFGSDDNIPDTARFVDGGMLSNFPVNIFYNPKVLEPRIPTFGVDLDDTNPEADNDDNVYTWTLGGYMGRMFNTIRYYYDKDFLIKNSVFKKGIGVIKLSEFNWLNFFLTDEDKIKMFIRGAESATEFLLGFNWPQYQEDRIAMQQVLNRDSGREHQPPVPDSLKQKVDEAKLADVKIPDVEKEENKQSPNQ